MMFVLYNYVVLLSNPSVQVGRSSFWKVSLWMATVDFLVWICLRLMLLILSLIFLHFNWFFCRLGFKLRLLLCLNVSRILNQCSLSLWEESLAPSSRPSSHWRPSRMCSRFRCQVTGSSTSASSRQPQLAARDSPVVPAPALYRQVTSKHTFSLLFFLVTNTDGTWRGSSSVTYG